MAEQAPVLPPATRLGRSMLTVGIMAPLLYVGYVGFHLYRILRSLDAHDQAFDPAELTGFLCLIVYGLLTAAAHLFIGLGFQRDRNRLIGQGSAAGIAACVIYMAACLVQWYTWWHARPGGDLWVSLLKWPPFLAFSVFIALVYLSGFKAATGGRPQGQLSGVMALLAGLLYSVDATVQAVGVWHLPWIDRVLSVYPVLYGLLIGGMMMAFACQLMDLQVNDARAPVQAV